MKHLFLGSVALCLLAVVMGCGEGGGNDNGVGPSDTVSPSAVTDLRCVFSTPSSAILSWTAPGDDGHSGTAAQYQIRYSTTAITSANWSAATPATNPPTPAVAGAMEAFRVVDLVDGTTYYFALKTADEGPNWSDVSSVATTQTGNHSRQITTAGGSSPTWSPDGLKIAFCTPNEEISWVPATGGPGTPIDIIIPPDTSVIYKSGPAWSPLGDKIAFVTVSNPHDQDVWLVPWSGGIADQIVDHGNPSGSGPRMEGLAWSPDATKIAFATDVDTYPERSIWIMPATGGVATPLTPGWYCNRPSWKPDGSRVAFDRTQYIDEHTGTTDIWTVVATGGGPKQITTLNGEGPTWSPDGKWLAYYDICSLCIIPANGGTPQVLVDGVLCVSEPAWSPDGSKIAFNLGDHQQTQIWVVDLQ